MSNLSIEQFNNALTLTRNYVRALVKAGAPVPDVEVSSFPGIDLRYHLTVDTVPDDQVVIDAVEKVFGVALDHQPGAGYATLEDEVDGLTVKVTVWSTTLTAPKLEAVK